MNPKIYGTEHIIFLAIFFVLSALSLILISKYVKTEKTKTIIIKILAGILLCAILCNRISIAVLSNDWRKVIPNSFCGMDSLILSLALLFGKKDNAVLHFVVYFAFIGGLGTILYPTFIDTYSSIFHPITFSGLIHHAIGLYITVLLQVVGWFTPNYKKWKNIVVGFLAYITLGAFLIFGLGLNTAFYINEPIIDGTPLTVWVLIPIFAVGFTLYMLVDQAIRFKIHKKKETSKKQVADKNKTNIN